ncbi:MAG TPA: GNAT family N-acetyltransferase [Candidatus Elarobacter sp.]|jgi:GNAT superfamily N-acetyltransferase
MKSTGAPETARFFFALDGAMIDLRRAHGTDAHDLALLRADSLAEQGYVVPAQREPFVREAEDSFARAFARDGMVAWLLCDGETVVGSACAMYFERLPFPDGSLHAELSGVYVAPAYRRRGWASKLVAAVVDDVRRSPVRKTFLRPAPGKRALYARLGFVDDATGVMSLSAR